MHSEIVEKAMLTYGLNPEILGPLELGLIIVYLGTAPERLKDFGMNPGALTEFDKTYLGIILHQRQLEILRDRRLAYENKQGHTFTAPE